MEDIKKAELESLIRVLADLRSEMIQLAADTLSADGAIDTAYLESARNLLHYVAFRRHDLCPVQGRLATLGLSSLGRAESHVLGCVDAVLLVLHRLVGRTWQPPENQVIGLGSWSKKLIVHESSLEGSEKKQTKSPSPKKRNELFWVCQTH